ncbi:anti-sigma factor family protein [Gluconacetobacter asukensis]|uniref:Anti-sigma factor n=1 Tax=Gluconacetobacter asukensis TaxID=1017181 RepID=A0A7W4J3H9_9PROT|nr:anti-sigma factor [Gluconacetobacter asukensis]MBB2174016.1 anti-sigma factor [Gluconacetobacter asukensis]
MTLPERPVTEDDLHAWVDDLLSPERRRTVDAWLATNPEAQRHIAAWRRERDLLSAAMDAELQDPVPARFDVARLRQRRPQRISTPQMAASVVLALAAGLGGGWLLRDRYVPIGIASVEQEAAMLQDARVSVAVTGGDTVQLAAWGSRALGRSVRPPDLSAAGYNLTGGQLVTTDHGPACLFFYRDGDGTQISLFVRPMHGKDMTAPMRPMRRTPGYVWAQDGLGISMMADTPVSGLHALADRARELM